MAIKMPHNVKPESAEAKADAFISGAGSKAVAPAPKKPKKTVVNMRFDPGLLERLDSEADRRGISRTAWIHWAVVELLDERN